MMKWDLLQSRVVSSLFPTLHAHYQTQGQSVSRSHRIGLSCPKITQAVMAEPNAASSGFLMLRPA